NKGAGGVFGYDHVIADNFRLGLALNGGAGKLKWYNDEDEGDLKLDSHWYGVNLYGTWTGKKVNVIANLGYSHQKDDGKDGIEDRNSHAINAGIRFETSFVAGGISFVPYYGVRFTHLSNGALKAWDDDKLTSVHMSDSNIWQFPVGVNAGFEYTCAAGWKSRTMIDLAVIPTAGKRKTYFSGEEGGSGRFANSVTYRGKVGLQLTKGQHSFGFMYGAAAGAHGSFGQNVTLNYQFMY
ncbi:MAG: autotransporter outer membrane beta-barrel domain-containing protein, partial [Parasutterella excrementihominis]